MKNTLILSTVAALSAISANAETIIYNGNTATIIQPQTQTVIVPSGSTVIVQDNQSVQPSYVVQQPTQQVVVQQPAQQVIVQQPVQQVVAAPVVVAQPQTIVVREPSTAEVIAGTIVPIAHAAIAIAAWDRPQPRYWHAPHHCRPPMPAPRPRWQERCPPPRPMR